MTISLVIPCYNLENYINELCEILSSHPHEEFEYIFIDDCSSDETPKIINSYKKIDSRFKLIKNKKNNGISESREIGIKAVKKKYICFLMVMIL